MKWKTGASPGEIAAIRQLTNRATTVDGVAPLSDQVLGALADDPVLLRYAPSGELVAVAVAHGSDPVELAVAPSFRRHGHGRQMIEAALERSGSIWAHGDLPGARQMATAAGLVPIRRLLQMRVTLPVRTEDRPLPEGYSIRTFTEDDADAVIEVNRRAFSWHPEQGRYSATDFARDRAQEWFDREGLFVAVDENDDVRGFHWTKVHRVDPTPTAAGAYGGRIGEVYVIGVDPDVRGLGLPLTLAGLDYLADRGLDQVMLYVESDNAPAVGMYTKLGFKTAVNDVVYGRPASDVSAGQDRSES